MATGSPNSNLDAGLLASMAAPAAAGGSVGGAGTAGSAPADTPAPTTNYRQEAKETWQCVAMLSISVPALKEVYTEETIDRLADVWGPIFERYNWNFGRFMPEIVAAAATLPVVGKTIMVIKEHRAEMARQAKEKADAQPAAA